MKKSNPSNLISEPPLSTLALSKALSLLRGKELFTGELRAKLGSEPSESVENAIQWLAKKGILNDDRLARSVANRRTGPKATSKGVIQSELEARYAPPEVISAVISDLPDELELAAAALSAQKSLGDRTEKGRARAFRALVRKGFDPDVAAGAIESAFGPLDE